MTRKYFTVYTAQISWCSTSFSHDTMMPNVHVYNNLSTTWLLQPNFMFLIDRRHTQLEETWFLKYLTCPFYKRFCIPDNNSFVYHWSTTMFIKLYWDSHRASARWGLGWGSSGIVCAQTGVLPDHQECLRPACLHSSPGLSQLITHGTH